MRHLKRLSEYNEVNKYTPVDPEDIKDIFINSLDYRLIDRVEVDAPFFMSLSSGYEVRLIGRKIVLNRQPGGVRDDIIRAIKYMSRHGYDISLVRCVNPDGVRVEIDIHDIPEGVGIVSYSYIEIYFGGRVLY